MVHKPLSNIDVALMLAAFVAVGLSVPVAAWLSGQLLQHVQVASAWVLLYLPVALLLLAAFGRTARQH